jgi:hypothetical protein
MVGMWPAIRSVSAAAIAHIGHFEPGALEKQRHQEIAGAARPAAAGIGELLLLRLHVGDEFRNGLRRQLRVYDQDLRRYAEQADGREVLHRVVADLGDRGKNRDDRGARPQQGGAVGRRARDRLGGDQAVAADPVLDHELLAECLAQARGGEPPHDVDIAPGREWHQHLHRPLRPALCEGDGGGPDQGYSDKRTASSESQIESALRHFATRYWLFAIRPRHSSR